MYNIALKIQTLCAVDPIVTDFAEFAITKPAKTKPITPS